MFPAVLRVLHLLWGRCSLGASLEILGKIPPPALSSLLVKQLVLWSLKQHS